jgi:hypothetical protein
MAEPQNPKLTFLLENIDYEIGDTFKSHKYYRSMALWPFMISSALSALVTVLLGLNNFLCLKEWFRVSALLLTAMVTVLNAFSAFYKNRENWVAYTVAETQLYKLKFDIDYDGQDGHLMTDAEVNVYKQRYQKILDELNNAWRHNRKSGS